MKLILPLLFIFFSIILAQDSVLLQLIGFPACSISCLEHGFADSGCKNNNYTCICSTGAKAGYINLINCMTRTKPCSLPDIDEAGTALTKLCAAVGYPYGNSSTNSSAAANYTVVGTIPDLITSSRPNSASKVALGVGLGIGIPLVATIGALAGFFFFRTRQRRTFSPSALAYGSHTAAQHSIVPYELDGQTKLQELESRRDELES